MLSPTAPDLAGRAAGPGEADLLGDQGFDGAELLDHLLEPGERSERSDMRIPGGKEITLLSLLGAFAIAGIPGIGIFPGRHLHAGPAALTYGPPGGYLIPRDHDVDIGRTGEPVHLPPGRNIVGSQLVNKYTARSAP